MGRLKAKGKGSRGTVLLDVLVGLFIATTALLVILGSIALAARIAKQSQERVIQLITSRNEYAEQRKVVFTEELLKE